MLVDNFNEFSDAQDVSGAAGTTVSTNVVDLGVEDRDIGNGQPVYLNVLAAEDFAGGTSIQVLLETSDNEAFSSGNYIALYSPVIAIADATAGSSLLQVSVPVGTSRYLRVSYSRVGTVTTGTVNAFLSTIAPKWVSKPATSQD